MPKTKNMQCQLCPKIFFPGENSAELVHGKMGKGIHFFLHRIQAIGSYVWYTRIYHFSCSSAKLNSDFERNNHPLCDL